MRFVRSILALGLLTAMCAGAAHADTITFSGLTGAASSMITTPYTEGNFVVNFTSGDWRVGRGFPNRPLPDIYSNSDTSFIDVNTITNSAFTFSGVDLGDGSVSSTATYTLTGLLAGATVFTTSGTVSPFSYPTIASPNSSALINDLRISFRASQGSYNVDNIGVTPFAAPAVPEPGAVAMMVGLSVTGAGFLARRRKALRNAA